jgi:hypothetical protein
MQHWQVGQVFRSPACCASCTLPLTASQSGLLSTGAGHSKWAMLFVGVHLISYGIIIMSRANTKSWEHLATKTDRQHGV